MDKNIQKRNNYNTEILNATAKYFSYTPRYVRKCLRGDAQGIMPDKVVKKYKELKSASEKAIEQKIQE